MSLFISAVSNIPNSEDIAAPLAGDAISLAGDVASPKFGICHPTHLFGTYHNKSNHLPVPSKTSYARRTTYSCINVWKSQCCWKTSSVFLSFQNLYKNFFSILHFHSLSLPLLNKYLSKQVTRTYSIV